MKVVVCMESTRASVVPDTELEGLWRDSLEALGAFDEIVIKKEAEVDGEILRGAAAVIGWKLNGGSLSEEFLEQFPNLRYVATLNHGYGAFDKMAAKRHGVTVTNTVYGDVTVAQFTMALLLELCSGTAVNDSYYRNHHFEQEGPRRNPPPQRQMMELYNKTIGIIGLGRIGLWVARMAQGFGMHVAAYSRHKKQGPEYAGIEQTSLEELLAASDVISLHCPLNEATKGMIDEAVISRMKDGVILLNTARGALIEEHALYQALVSGKVAAAGLDVLTGEPLQEKSELFLAPNTILTPHIAWLTPEALRRQVEAAASNLRAWLAGKPVSVIS